MRSRRSRSPSDYRDMRSSANVRLEHMHEFEYTDMRMVEEVALVDAARFNELAEVV